MNYPEREFRDVGNSGSMSAAPTENWQPPGRLFPQWLQALKESLLWFYQTVQVPDFLYSIPINPLFLMQGVNPQLIAIVNARLQG